jgi:hypothetical protein
MLKIAAIKLSLVLMAFTFSACVTPYGPTPGPFEPPPAVKDSFITVPIGIDQSLIGNLIDEHLSPQPGGIYYVTGQKLVDHGDLLTVTLQIGLHRSAATVVTSSGNTVSIHIQIEPDSDPRIDVHALTDHTKFPIPEDPLTVIITCTINVNQDWSLAASINSDFSWQSPPKLCVDNGLYCADVSGIVNPLITKELPKINQELQAEVAKVPFRDLVNQGWTTIQKPIPLAKQPPVTLYIKPSSAGSSGFSTDQQYVYVTPALVAKVHGELAPPSSPPPPVNLPDKSGSPTLDAVNLSLRLDLPYKELNTEAKTLLAGQTFADTNSENKITVTDVNLGAAGGSEFFVKIYFHSNLLRLFFIRGWLYFTATPHYDDAHRQITFENVNFDPHTSSKLVQFAAWIAHTQINDYIQSHLVINVKPEMEPLHNIFDAGFTNREISTSPVYRVSLDMFPGELVISDFYLTSDTIGLVTTFNGAIAAHVSETSPVRQ